MSDIVTRDGKCEQSKCPQWGRLMPLQGRRTMDGCRYLDRGTRGHAEICPIAYQRLLEVAYAIRCYQATTWGPAKHRALGLVMAAYSAVDDLLKPGTNKVGEKS